MCLERQLKRGTAPNTLALGRGFVEVVTVNADTWPDASELLRRHPLRLIRFEGDSIRIWIRKSAGAWSTYFDDGSRSSQVREWEGREAIVEGLVQWMSDMAEF